MTDRPLRLGGRTLRNRLASAPMERNYCDTAGHVTEQYKDYLVRRAEAGIALVTTEATYVRADGKGRTHQLGAHDDSCIDGLRELAEAIHEQGALLCCELNHGGRTAQSKVSGLPNVAPSPVPCSPAGGEMPRELTTEECYELVRAYGAAAARCVAAGIDVLNIHAAHGYLVHQFMSPVSNHRDDEFAQPELFLNLVIDAVRAAAPDVALGVRVSVVEGSSGGLSAEQTFDIVSRAHLDQVDFLDLSAGSYEAGEWIVQSGEWQPGVLADYAGRYRALGTPLGMAGRLNSPEIIEKTLQEGTADFVSLARALHADPRFAAACLSGGSYRPCIACNVCIDNLGAGQVACTVNPTAGRGRVPLPAPEVPSAARTVVVGAGPAGLTAARELAVAGAAVTVFDSSCEIGGDMRIAASMKSTPDFSRFLDWSADEIDRWGITLRTGTEVTASRLAAESPDAVVLATGGVPPDAGIEAGDGARVLDIRDWLRAHGSTAAPEACTIWGADTVAMTVADTFAGRGTKVLLVGAEHEIAPDSGRRAKILAVPRLQENPATRVLLNSRITLAKAGQVLVSSEAGEQEWVQAPGPLLVSQGVRTDDSAAELVPGGVPHVRVGAAGGSGETLLSAIRSGYDAARQLAARIKPVV
ncbi:oxidoreductase [Haloactinomyces albus]